MEKLNDSNSFQCLDPTATAETKSTNTSNMERLNIANHSKKHTPCVSRYLKNPKFKVTTTLN